MAILSEVEGSLSHPLPARLLVGRSSSCSLPLADKKVSGEHASLAWNGEQWTLRDLASRNGTFINGSRLDSGGTAVVKVGDRVSFGDADGGFTLVDAGPPAAMATHGSQMRVARDGLLALPDATDPEVVIYADGVGMWRAERDEASEPVSDGQALTAGGKEWVLRIPAHLEGTATVDAGPTLDTVKLEFAVSLDEEHVELTVVHRGKRTTLEAREHGYILLTLARARVADEALPLAEQGWVDRDRLLKMLGTDTNALNVGIYRARGQLGSAKVDGAAGVVEVRRGQRRFGLEPSRIHITSL